MDVQDNLFFRKSDLQRSSVLQQLLRDDDSFNESKMSLPAQLEIISKKNDTLAYIKAREAAGFDLLPLFELNKEKEQPKYCLGLNDILAKKWDKYQQVYRISIEEPVMPNAKDVRFDCQKVISPGCKDQSCGMQMGDGPKLDETGPVPIAADTLHRYRAKLASIKAKRAKNPFK